MSSSYEQRACAKGESHVHQLICGHFVKFDCNVCCKANCKHVDLPYQKLPYTPSLFIICEGCILESFMQQNKARFEKMYDALNEDMKYIEGDRDARYAIRVKALEEAWLLQEYIWYLNAAENGQIQRGGVLSIYVSPGKMMEEMTQRMMRATIENKEQDMMDLFGALSMGGDKDKQTE